MAAVFEPTTVAGQLRRLAELLETADGLPVGVFVGISPRYSRDQGGRVATVDAIAARLGLTAEPTKDGSCWYHAAREDRGEFSLWLHTDIDGPAQRCACGAVCTHDTDNDGDDS